MTKPLVTTELTGFDKLSGALRGVQGPALKVFLTSVRKVIFRAAVSAAPRDSGTLARSFASEVKPTSARVWSKAAHANTLESGRSRGAPQGPARRISQWGGDLADWAERHGFRGSLFLLAQSIATRGSRGRFFMAKAKKTAEGALPRLLGAMGKGIEDRFNRKAPR